MKIKGQRFDTLDGLFAACLEGRLPDAIFRASVTPQPPAKWLLVGTLVLCIPPIMVIPIVLSMVAVLTFPLWFAYLIYVVHFKDVGYNLGDYIFVAGDEFTIVRGVQQDIKTERFRAYSVVTRPISEILNFGDWLTAAVMENQAGKLPIQTKYWVYFVAPFPVPMREGIHSRIVEAVEPLEGLVPALLGRARAVHRLDG
ncbi:MAG: hypothetical protein JWM80_212 [Cyanobacteria bacterium RYN_339]|nr:hypothetical protein [Cyanobacteria bacterium RYN_339]